MTQFLPGLRALLSGSIESKSLVVGDTRVNLSGSASVTRLGGVDYGPGTHRADAWDVDAAVAQGYERVVWVYRCVELMTGDSSRLPLRIGRHLGYLPQFPDLVGGTVRDVIARFDPAVTDESVIAAAKLTGIHELVLGLPQGYATEVGGGDGVGLSGGQMQRIAIATAIAAEPHVLIADEATSALDPETTQAVLALLRDINRELGLTILLITHEMAVVRDICHHVAVMEAGRIVETGKTYDIFANPQDPVTRSFLSGVTGTVLPGFIARRITPDGTGPAILRITFAGDSATHPVLSRLGAELGIDASILGGAIEEIDGRPFGNLTVQMPAEALPRAQAYLHAHDLRTEVLGHVG